MALWPNSKDFSVLEPINSFNSLSLITLILLDNKGFLITPFTYLPSTYSPKKRILMMSENRVKIMDNLEAIDTRLKERKLDKQYKILYSFL